MARRLISCSYDASLSEIDEKMRRSQIRRMPVVDLEGRLAGIVTLADGAKSSQASPLRASTIPGIAKTLAAVCEPRAVASAAE